MKVLAWPAFENKTGNPYTGLLYEAVEEYGVSVDDFTLARALTGGYDLWHVHWPDDFLSYRSPGVAVVYVVTELLLMLVARLRGANIVWTIHDLGPHESPHPWLERLFWPLFLPLVDGVITLSEYAWTAAVEAFPVLRSVPNAVVPHGHYRPAYPAPVTKEEARGEWKIPEDVSVVSFVGRIRPYKNVEHLVRTVRQVSVEDLRLLVAGNPSSEEVERRIRAAAADDDRVRLHLRFIPEARIPSLLGATDLVILPYEDILHSGSALLALSFDRPVLVPNEGAMAELQTEVGTDWVYTFDPPLTPETVTGTLETVEDTDRAERAPLDHLSWDRLAHETVSLYERVLASR